MEKKEESYRPTSKAGEASGERSVVIVKMPSNFLSGYGDAMLAEMRHKTLCEVTIAVSCRARR